MVAFEAQVVTFFVEAANLLGVPKSVAAIYGVIFASPEPLSFGEIEARLEISKGSVSQGLRVLRDVGAVREAQQSSEPLAVSSESDSQLKAPSSPFASRSAHYEPDLELRKLVAHFLETRLENQLKEGSSKLKALTQAIPALAAADDEKLRTRLKSLSDWHKKTSGLLPIAKTFLKLT